MSLKRIWIILTFAAMALAVPTVALANSPHFVSASAAIITSGSYAGDLKVSFKEAGLGNNETVTEEASADAAVTWACFNGGGKNPQATQFWSSSGPVTSSGEFSSGKNGQITGSLLVTPPGGGDVTCPKGQTKGIASVTYTNVKITDTNYGDYLDIPGTFSWTITAKKK